MTTTEWAENEVKLACKGASKYGDTCLKSALKAYKSMSRDGHSGLSFQITRNILEKLLRCQPLTPITENDFEDGDEGDDIQCRRMFSLFKKTKDGKVIYSDIDRVAYTDNGGESWYMSGFTTGLIDHLFPITLPYTPKHDPYKVYVKTDIRYRGGILLHIDHILTPEYDKIEVDSYWVCADVDDFVRCDKKEFKKLKKQQGEMK